MNCPRCKAVIGTLADPDSIVTCSGCGARLMTRAAALRSQGGAVPLAAQTSPALNPPPPAPDPPPQPASAAPASSPADLPPESTLPGTPASALGLRPPPRETESPKGTGTSRRKGKAEPKEAVPGAVGSATLEMLLRELRAIREAQQQVLDLLRGGSGPRSYAHATGRSESDGAMSLSPIRALRPKSVVLIDDDPATRDAAVAELLQADVPVRAFEDGNAALQGIAEEKPDVIVLELGLRGEMAGKDMINMIKATMEWVDIPVVLWTREPVASQKEARLVHGADEIVPKSSGTAALAARIITVFRRA